MAIGKRILLSVFAGWIIAGLLIFIAFYIDNDQLTPILLWNGKIIGALAGNGPLLGYDAQGNPMYEGTPVHLFFGLLGLLSSFIIYPILVFIVLTIMDKLYSKKNGLTEL